MSSAFSTFPFNSVIKSMVAPISINGTAATVTEIDLEGSDFAEVTLQLGAIGAADFDSVLLTHSDTAGSGHATISGSTVTVTATDDGKIVRWYIDLRDKKRYLSATLDPGAVACLVALDCRLYRNSLAPSTATERGNTLTEVFL